MTNDRKVTVNEADLRAVADDLRKMASLLRDAGDVRWVRLSEELRAIRSAAGEMLVETAHITFTQQQHKTRHRLRAALDALGPELCGHPSQRMRRGNHAIAEPDTPWFRCIAPKGHHTFDHHRPCCDEDNPGDPIHCGDAHVPPAEVWAEHKENL